MENHEKSNVIVELYDLPLTRRKDDRFGRVVTARSLSEDDLIAMAVSRRTDLNPTTIRASMDIMQELALEQIVNGASVCFGLGYFNLCVNGVFVGDNAHWDSSKHHLSINITPTTNLRNALKDCKTDMSDMLSRPDFCLQILC